tara:strand:- start:759 stop:1007 length:249 start_codon:yes stop_codon:yes gene_type:complete
MPYRYKYKELIMDWKSTALVNMASIGLSLTQIEHSVKIGAMIVGIAWTIIQIINGINVFLDRKSRLDRVKKYKKKKKNKNND